MVSEDYRNQLRGRRGVCEALEQLASRVEGGQSAALVLRGEAGIGKSALLDHLAERAREHRIARAAGAESEMELPFAGLQQLCAPLLGSLHRLPGAQSQALTTAFGMSAGPPPDRFLVGLAALGLLTAVAAEQPLFCLVDDAQWLDRVSAQTLAFIARRMHAEPLALVFTLREFQEQGDFEALPEVTLQGLDDGEACLLLESAAHGPMDDRLRARILAEARGNPLALLELRRDLTGTELPDTLGLPDPGPVAGRVERSFLGRVRSLPPQTQRLLLTAAAEPIGDVALFRRAVEKLGIEPGAAHPAIAARLIDIGTLVRFRHPLLRSAVYRSAGLSTRRETHRVLAEVTDPALDPDRRAWHLARATMRPDEETAAELESSAGRAQTRGGAAAAAAFLARAAILTPEPQRKALRAVAAAQAKLRAGAPDAARELLAIAERGNLNELDEARVDLLHAHIAFASSRRGDASSLLKAAARRLAPLDTALAREAFLDAVSAAMFAGRLAGDTDVRDIAQAARQTLPAAKASRHADLLLDALTLRFAEEYPAAAGASRAAVDSLRRSTDAAEVLRWSWLTSALAAETWDEEGWQKLVARHVDTARALGALSELPLALSSQVLVHTCTGEFEAAALLVAEIPLVLEASGGSLVPYGALGLAAWQGKEREADALIQSSLDDAATRGEGIGVAIAQRARAVLYNGLGKYEQALEAACQASTRTQDLVAANWGLTEAVEAAVRSGNHGTAHTAMERLARTTDAAGTHWALGTQARSRALLSEGDVAEGLYREAIERLAQTRMESDLARTHLLYGEWLRRENRRIEARVQLRAAQAMFIRFGACAFTERTDRELRATGETVAKRSDPAPTALTAQETQIARLARDGLTNTEIGAQLFLSPHTVEWHLRKVFTKLAITSRRQLRSVLTDGPAPPAS
ncbi:AAA family ATPase [Streptomyces olivaceus]|uniref:AAA family ATPase n=1 Tax=Streptomyces olivaceus TaxID=47716 RepID=UPI001CCA01A0|nr:LuxR family transcriptional regulator [Streptomyces olivaceus]MBZ6254092.1 AAA family ATPase [Streptomyces olivaceus]